MKRNNLCIGILADVDAGKTTLSERILYECGVVREPGRVDSGSAFLDTDALEKQRGITIFTKEAVFSYKGADFTLVDTPGHADFSAEAERALSVLDAAILVISGTDGVTRRASDMFRSLAGHGIPLFIFVNKTDLLQYSEDDAVSGISALTQKAAFFARGSRPSDEDLALTGDKAMSLYDRNGTFEDTDIARLVSGCSLIPCYFGSALKGDGVSGLLDGISRYLLREDLPDEFAARVFKISYDDDGTRLTHIKVTGGSLAVRDVLNGEKIVSLRSYSGIRYTRRDVVYAGEICAAAGLKKTYAGEGLGACADLAPSENAEYLTYRVTLPEGVSELSAYEEIRRLGEEAPELDVRYDSDKNEMRIGIKGDVHMQTIASVIRRRTGFDVAFDSPSVVYKETVGRRAEGIGHFEPLRHYAEVHLLLEPLETADPARSGQAAADGNVSARKVAGNNVPGDNVPAHSAYSVRDYSRNVIGQDIKAGNISQERCGTVLQTLASSELKGVLTGAELTGVKMTLIAGQEYVDHTESGDFREAAMRALRQGLMNADPVLLEPYCSYRVSAPRDVIGRISNDIIRSGGSVISQFPENDSVIIEGEAALSFLRPYASELPVISSGRADIAMEPCGYRPCADQIAVVNASGYDPLRNAGSPCDSVFCRNGSSVVVPWNEVPEWCHIEPVYRKRSGGGDTSHGGKGTGAAGDISIEEIESILKLVSRGRGAERKKYPRVVTGTDKSPKGPGRQKPSGPQKYVVDGYNLIYAWKDLRSIAEDDIGAAREKLIEILADFSAYRGAEMTIVFDAYRSESRGPREETVLGVGVVFTGENQTADSWIERYAFDHGKNEHLSVVTSDRLEQINVFGSGASRIGSHEFAEILEDTAEEIRGLL